MCGLIRASQDVAGAADAFLDLGKIAIGLEQKIVLLVEELVLQIDLRELDSLIFWRAFAIDCTYCP